MSALKLIQPQDLAIRIVGEYQARCVGNAQRQMIAAQLRSDSAEAMSEKSMQIMGFTIE